MSTNCVYPLILAFCSQTRIKHFREIDTLSVLFNGLSIEISMDHKKCKDSSTSCPLTRYQSFSVFGSAFGDDAGQTVSHN